MVTMTRHGKRSTTPKGIEMFELPFNRILRPKNDIFGLRVLDFSVAVPSEAIASVPVFDTRLAMLEVNPMPCLALHRPRALFWVSMAFSSGGRRLPKLRCGDPGDKSTLCRGADGRNASGRGDAADSAEEPASDRELKRLAVQGTTVMKKSNNTGTNEGASCSRFRREL